MELVTAVITTHKRPPEIVDRAIKSVVAQTYKNIEIIIVDDSPVDYPLRGNIKELICSYREKNIKYVPHETCKGACAARNTALSLATGKYIGYLDDDDEWKPNKIEQQIKLFDNEKVALVYCGSENMNDNSGIVSINNTVFCKGDVYDKLIFENFIGSTSFSLMRTDALRSIGGFDVLMESAQDYDVWLRLAQIYEIDYVEDVLVRYHLHSGEQITKNPRKKINGLERLNEKNAFYLDSNRKAKHIRWIKVAPFYAADGQKGTAIKIWIKSVWLAPLAIKTNLRYLYLILRSILQKKK